ncbi:MAG TPA: hypothetical protein VF647_03595 [Longimicrobium sp.]
MADIDVERNRGSVWPWVIGGLAVLLLGVAIWSLLNGGGGEVRVRQATPETVPAAGS